MGDRDALALDDVDPERGRVEQDVRQVVVEEVDLVDVEDAAVRLGEQARLERRARPRAAPGRCRPCPATRSSVAFSGRSTIRRRRRVDRQLARRAARARHDAQGSAGSHENGQSATTSISGSSSASPRTAVDFPVPLGPSISTPPTAGLTALSRSARLRRSCSTIAVNGK